ncbi:E3 ubiquitin-protein ligase PPP1R11-like [Ylistrum balloti]|uniref:E3 ubiquitin-protein ligase PPP1R11-like n=1 Tax=Ylistrum balloti TaxID=509963 RepID=UPI002905F70D|nr:E3 ubiquitin-protein ligase PPP1R11-like [Ylistrum balloti]
MATAQSATVSASDTILEHEQPPDPHSPTLRLKLRKPKNDNSKKVKWTTETVDNEHMNKKKSKCCCQYQKPRMFGESSSEDEDDCNSCSGHKDKCYRAGDNQAAPGNGSLERGSSEH